MLTKIVVKLSIFKKGEFLVVCFVCKNLLTKFTAFLPTLPTYDSPKTGWISY